MNSRSTRYDYTKPRAIALREQGKMFSEITDILGFIPKSTMSNWFKNIELTDKQRLRIAEIKTKNGQKGRYIGAQKNHIKRIERLRSINKIAISEYPDLSKDPLFIAGLVLYLAEGSKKSEQFLFMNSDPKLVKFMTNWVVKNSEFSLEDLGYRLYIHRLYENEECETFWQKELGLQADQFRTTIYKPTVRKHKKNPKYKGCLRLEVPGSELYWKIITWRDCFYMTIT